MDKKSIKKTAAIVTLGCKVNKYESDGMAELLEKDGYEIIDSENKADVYIINTCSVTNMAEKKSRQMIHRMKRKNPESIIIVAGCYVNAAKEELELDDSIDMVIGNNKKKEIVEILKQYIIDNNIYGNYVDINEKQEYESFHLTKIMDHTRAYVKIQDGCNQFCSYCIIPYVRGRVRSRSVEDIIEEIESLTANGIKEIVFTGIHISSYGVDFENKNIDLLYLINVISDIDGVKRIRLGSLEPRIITEKFVSSICNNEKICPHFHLSLQSGCNDTLKRMNRKYTIEEYMVSCDLLRKYYDRPAITTDIIVGFPGETEEEFDTTYKSLVKLNLYEMHIFKYSVRKGTMAEKMPNQVPENIKNMRSDKLLELADKNKKQFEDSFVGESLSVLIEEKIEKDGITMYTGHSMRYIKVTKNIENVLVGDIIEVEY